ncbi:sigma-70 family RNA polymerase sigma factor [Staphylococcus aureus]|nr:sigma-70 family RNA polymerase sigma factor [Staphylococcus aureus]
MKFNDVYNKHHKIIHHLLKKYNISCNYDEYYQLLLIKMWQLSQIYKPSSNQSLSSFLFMRLNFYLIDLFRQQKRLNDIILCENNSPTLTEQPTYFNEHNLRLQDICKLLNDRERLWLKLYLEGYKQFEIADIMSLSTSTIKLIKASVKRKCQRFLN